MRDTIYIYYSYCMPRKGWIHPCTQCSSLTYHVYPVLEDETKSTRFQLKEYICKNCTNILNTSRHKKELLKLWYKIRKNYDVEPKPPPPRDVSSNDSPSSFVWRWTY
jgi:hypothetical protein